MEDSETNPYHSPEVSTGKIGNPSSKLVPVAISLISASALWILMIFSGIGYFYFLVYNRSDANADDRGFALLNILYLCFLLIWTLFVIIGSINMVRRGSYLWAVTTCILAMVPVFGPCYFVGIPLGIWGLVVLRKPDVRASFHSN